MEFAACHMKTLTCHIWWSQSLLVGAWEGRASTCVWRLQLGLAATAALPRRAPDRALGLLQASTYNVNGRLPQPGLDLRPWLDAGAGADIVAVAFQECVPLSATNVVMGAACVYHDYAADALMYCMCQSQEPAG